MASYYLLIKAFHLIAVIAWMAGLLYLPRLFVYHSKVLPGSKADTMLQTMERRLLRYIMTPAMVATLVFGGALVHILVENGGLQGWFHVKMFFLLILFLSHGLMARYRKDFVMGKNRHSEKFFRIFNEVPTVSMIFIVILAVMKPF